MFGYTLEEVSTIPEWYPRAFPDPAYREKVSRIWEDAITKSLNTGAEMPPVEARVLCKDGTFRDIEFLTVIVKEKLLTIFTDVTERKKDEMALRASESFLNIIIDESPNPIWIADEKGTLIRINKSCCRLLGITEEDVLNRYNVFEDSLVIKDGLVPLIRSAFDEGKAIRFDMAYDASHLQLSRSGSCPRVILDITMYPILADDGKVRNVVVQHIDVTERRRAEDALRKSEERFRGMAEQLLDTVFQVDADGLFTYLSPSVVRMFGCSPEEMTGKRFGDFLSEEEATEASEAFQSVLSSGEPIRNLGLELQRADGTHFHGEVNVSRASRDGEVVGALGLIRDVTERIEAEAARQKLESQLRQAQKMEAVGQLAGGIAHDFNNLLQVVFGHLDLLEDDLGPESPSRQELADMRKAAERATELTRQLLAFGRRQIIQPVNLDLNDLVHGVTKMIRRVIGEHIELLIIAGERLGTVYADKGQIEQVLMNLCVNARDAMPSGGTLTISTENAFLDHDYCRDHPWALEGRYVLVSVTDTGHGMDDSVREQIFEPFFTTKDVGQGTGLGLATVYGIVKQHNGLIHVYSEPLRGTVFKVYLPIVERHADEVRAEVEVPITGGAETILVAEDDKSVRELLCRMLEEAGYTVLSASDGEDALRVYKEHEDKVDIAILDVMMPKLGGRAVMDRILFENPAMRFLFSSGYSEGAIHTNFVIKEGLRLINKPYRRTEILRAVRAALDERKAGG